MSTPASGDPWPPAAMQTACLEALAASSSLAVGAVREGVLVHASAALRRAFALAENEAGKPFAQLVAPLDRERVARAVSSPGGSPVTFRAQRADGSLFEAEISTVRAALLDGPATVLLLLDLTERERAARVLSYLSLVDPATGLPNRQALIDRLQAALSGARRSGRPAVAMLLELEGIDATQAGAREAALRAAGTLLQQSLRETDLVAYLGAAQFGVLLPRVDERSHAAIAAGRLLAALARPAGGEARASVGIAAYPEDGASADLLLEGARAALAQARSAGGARYAFAAPGVAVSPGLPAYVRWSARYEVGVDVLDGQHRELLERINRLGDALRSEREFDRLVEALKELVRYTEHHFATEERLMDELGARSERHRAEHRRLLESLMRFTLRLNPDGVSQSAAFLQEWLFRHIDEVDRPFAAFLRNHGVGE